MELPPEHAGMCPDGWHKFGAFCYLPFPETLTWWQAAEEYCQKEGVGVRGSCSPANDHKASKLNITMAS